MGFRKRYRGTGTGGVVGDSGRIMKPHSRLAISTKKNDVIAKVVL